MRESRERKVRKKRLERAQNSEFKGLCWWVMTIVYCHSVHFKIIWHRAWRMMLIMLISDIHFFIFERQIYWHMVLIISECQIKPHKVRQTGVSRAQYNMNMKNDDFFHPNFRTLVVKNMSHKKTFEQKPGPWAIFKKHT